MLVGTKMVWLIAAAVVVACGVAAAAAAAATSGPAERRRGKLDRMHGASFRLGGVLGQRVKANVDGWVLAAPGNNPGLLDMFARRDAGKPIDLVPWAGEFVGKYLISGVQAMRMSDDPRLRQTLAGVVERLLGLQAEDGYIGPWPKAERLAGQWDLWGHYHVMLGLLMWHEHTGDAKALAAAHKAADLICKTYLGTARRVFDAGSHEMNMSVIHVLAILYRQTGRERYLRMAEEILKDFERAGDYLRCGLAGTEFFRTPRPRWESLHALQGLAELYRATGDQRYRDSFLHHWASIRRFDQRNTGGFSSGEQATGDPFADTPIETCCTIAWQAVMQDALRLTGDATIADDLELATFNAAAGAWHPSGAWATYDTPMNGKRVPSHVSINFQARPDAPGLNCCSVNAPRGLGILSEWAVMAGEQEAGDKSDPTITLNYFGPMRAETALPDGSRLALDVRGDYPIGDSAVVVVHVAQPAQFAMNLRIPGWSARTRVAVNGQDCPAARPGRYMELSRLWRDGDEVAMRFDMPVRCVAGDLEQYGRASLYRGPILLAWDERLAPRTVPPVDAAKLAQAKPAATADKFWLLVDVPALDGSTVRLCDFASAGSAGGEYRSWLAASSLAPPPPLPLLPGDGHRVPAGAIQFRLKSSRFGTDSKDAMSIVISESLSFKSPVVMHRAESAGDGRVDVPADVAARLRPGTTYYWKAVAGNANGQTESCPPHRRLVVGGKRSMSGE